MDDESQNHEANPRIEITLQTLDERKVVVLATREKLRGMIFNNHTPKSEFSSYIKEDDLIISLDEKKLTLAEDNWEVADEDEDEFNPLGDDDDSLDLDMIWEKLVEKIIKETLEELEKLELGLEFPQRSKKKGGGFNHQKSVKKIKIVNKEGDEEFFTSWGVFLNEALRQQQENLG